MAGPAHRFTAGTGARLDRIRASSYSTSNDAQDGIECTSERTTGCQPIARRLVRTALAGLSQPQHQGVQMLTGARIALLFPASVPIHRGVRIGLHSEGRDLL